MKRTKSWSKPTQKVLLRQILREHDGKLQCIAASHCPYDQDCHKYNPSNFKRHINDKHPAVFERLGFSNPPANGVGSARKKPKKMLVESDRYTVILGTLQLLTTNNMPYNFFEMTAYKTLLGPLYDAAGITLNRKNVGAIIEKGAELARRLIREEVTKGLVSLKIDSASRGNRHVFAINLQHYYDGKVVTRNLAVKEMHCRQTKENLANVILEVLNDYGIDIKQLYSVAHDNGSNMVATVKLLKEILKKCSLEGTFTINMLIVNPELQRAFEYADEGGFCDDDESENMDVAENCDNTDDADDDFSDGKDGNEHVEVQADVEDCPEFEGILDSTRCAAHTAQLAVWDIIKPYKRRIAKIQKLVVKLRHRDYHTMFKTHDAHLPPIANNTRWNSTFLMLKSLLNQKQFFNILKTNFPETDLTRHWQFIGTFCEAFEPAFLLTLKLQKEHVPLSEFYACWLLCQAQLAKLPTNKLAKRLLEAFKTRAQKLTSSLQFKACIYLDPRFNFLGSKRISTEDKEKIQGFLLKLYHRINEVEGIPSESEPIPPTDDEPDDDLEKYLSDFFEEDNIPLGKSHSIEESVLSQIKELEIREKVPMISSNVKTVVSPSTSTASNTSVPFDILKYWEAQKVISPVIHRLAMVVLSAPSTQVSVERAFSGLKLILSDHRMRLSEKSIENLMVLKLNSDLLYEVAEVLNDENDLLT